MLCKEIVHLASAVPHPVHKLHGRGEVKHPITGQPAPGLQAACSLQHLGSAWQQADGRHGTFLLGSDVMLRQIRDWARSLLWECGLLGPRMEHLPLQTCMCDRGDLENLIKKALLNAATSCNEAFNLHSGRRAACVRWQGHCHDTLAAMSARPLRRLLACWGNGDLGRLGHGVECANEEVPRVVAALADVSLKHVACGGAHTVAVTGAGRCPDTPDQSSASI